jgi:urease accessory protein
METSITLTDSQLLFILQLASPTLPVGAYSYSEGLETLVENGIITDAPTLKLWLASELGYGAIRLDGGVMVRAWQSAHINDHQMLCHWNLWLSAARETSELRASSWQMGRSLSQLFAKIQPEILPLAHAVGYPCNYAIAYGMITAQGKINLRVALLTYLQSWLSNLITAAVKLIPLGQTDGQELLLSSQELLQIATGEILALDDEHLGCCSWGLSLSSMQHETQYTRLFRS